MPLFRITVKETKNFNEATKWFRRTIEQDILLFNITSGIATKAIIEQNEMLICYIMAY